jgi:hypothetical protein
MPLESSVIHQYTHDKIKTTLNSENLPHLVQNILPSHNCMCCFVWMQDLLLALSTSNKSGCLRMGCWGQRKWQDGGEHCMMGSCMTSTIHWILLVMKLRMQVFARQHINSKRNMGWPKKKIQKDHWPWRWNKSGITNRHCRWWNQAWLPTFNI